MVYIERKVVLTDKNKKDDKQKLAIRSAQLHDVPILLELIKELAVFEKLSDQVVTDEKTLAETLFGKRFYAEAELAIWEGQSVGMVIFFHNYSTFLGRPGLYIEDLYVKDTHRGLGIGKALFLHCAQIAKKRNCGRMEWSVLKWNPARSFYEKLGAYPLEEWTVYRMDSQTIKKLIG